MTTEVEGPSKGAPSVTKSGNKIVITGHGTPGEAIDVAIYRVVGGMDETPAVFSHSSTLDEDGNGTLTTPTLANGTYHVKTTAHPPGASAVIYNTNVTLP